MTEIEDWLKRLRLDAYAEAFAANDIGLDVLPTLTAEDLVELGVTSVGHKRILLNAIAALKADPQPAQAAGPTLAGERRPVTILFADLSGYTKLSGQLGSEQAHDLLQQYYAIADALISGNGGHVDKHIGDSVMGIFGAPVAHGNDAERAVLAALAIVKAMPELSRKTGLALEAHVGMAFGEVVAAMSGSAAHAAYTVIGDAVNVAARLTSVARSGEIVASDAVHRQLGGKAVAADLGAIELKGVAEPVRAWRIDDIGQSRPSHERRMIGRSFELAQLRALLEHVRASGSGAYVHVRGEAGIGKSRFVSELAAVAKDLGFRPVSAGFLDFGEELSRDAIRILARSLSGAGMAVPSAADLSSAVFVKDLLGLPLEETERARLAGADLPARLEGRSNALRLLTLAHSGPMMILVEDLHWADERQVGLLCRYCSSLSDQPVLVVTTSRPEREPLALGGAMSLSLLDLGPLRPDEARQLAADLVEIDRDLTAEMIARSGGNPLFLEHLLSFSSGPGGSVPDTLRNLILAGADRLAPEARSILQAAAVLGQKGSLDSLRAVLDKPDDAQVKLPARFLTAGEDGSYRFSHALVRDAIYQTMLSGNRRGLHSRAAGHFRDRDKGLFAQHLEMASDPSAAAAYLEAAREAKSRLAFERAVQFARSGLAIAAGEIAAELECIAGAALLSLGRTAESVTAFEQAEAAAPDVLSKAKARLGLAGALRVSDRLDRAEELLDLVLPAFEETSSWKELSEAWHLRGNLYFPKGLQKECAQAHDRALDYARLADSVPHLARALGGQADAAYAEGRLVTAARKFGECVELARGNGLMDIAAANANMAALARYFSGTGADSGAEAAGAIALARQVGLPRAEIIAHHAAMCICLWGGRPEQLEALFERAQMLSQQIGAKRFMSENLAFLGESMRMRRRLDEAESLLNEALSLSREFGMDFIGPVVLGYMAQLYADQPDKQAQLLAEGEALVRKSGLAHNKLFFNVSAIECHLGTRDLEAVERHARLLEQAFGAEELPAVTFIARRARALCRIAAGDTSLSDAELDEIRQLGTSVGHAVLARDLG